MPDRTLQQATAECRRRSGTTTANVLGLTVKRPRWPIAFAVAALACVILPCQLQYGFVSRQAASAPVAPFADSSDESGDAKQAVLYCCPS